MPSWHTVIGVAGKAVATPLELPVQFVEHHVGEHRRQRAALRHARGRGLNCFAHAHPGLEVAVDQAQQPPVRDVPLEPDHQPVVIDPIEECFQVKVDHPAVASTDVRLQLPHGLVRRALRTKSVAARVEVGFPLLTDDLSNGLLDEPVEHGGNTQRTLAPVWLGDLYPSYRLRAVAARNQLGSDLGPVLFELARQGIHAHAVDARRASVTSDLLQGTLQVRARKHAFH